MSKAKGEISDSPGGMKEDEVTETKIVGVTETGVIRKRSFKRKLTKEEKFKRYGQDKKDYAKIIKRVMAERLVVGTLEGLRERLKMISFMHEDCMDMVTQWEHARATRLKTKRLWSIKISLLAMIGAIVTLALLWCVVRLVW